MSCDCDKVPCERSPFRCSCQRDCWIGAPGDYETCLAACDLECDFPEHAGLPHEGYTCPDWPSVDQAACDTDCNDTESDDLNDCDSALTSCLSGCSDQTCEDNCHQASCECTAAASLTGFLCRFDCKKEFEIPESFACLEADLDSDDACCGTVLGTCYRTCESAFLVSMEPLELAWVDDLKTAYTAAYSTSTYDPTGGTCSHLTVLPRTGHALRKLFADSAPVRKALRLCRVECEDDELSREDPADRKFKECGGDYMVCQEKCGGDMDLEHALCADAYDTCVTPCDALSGVARIDCIVDCDLDYRNCYKALIVDRGDCLMDCCKAEYDHADNGHDRADCYWECFKTRSAADIDCRHLYAACYVACGGIEGCIETCRTDFCLCKVEWTDLYNDCIGPCKVDLGDCPDCFKSTELELGDTWFGPSEDYEDETGSGLPGMGPDPEATTPCT